MKKILISLIAIVSIFMITGCGSKSNEPQGEDINVSLGDLKLKLPSVFEKGEESSSDMIFYDYTSEDMKNACMMYISVWNVPSTNIKEDIKTGLLNSNNINYSDKNINGNNWTIGSVYESEKYSKYFYAINYNNNFYQISYEDGGSGDLCKKYLNTIENSLNF